MSTAAARARRLAGHTPATTGPSRPRCTGHQPRGPAPGRALTDTETTEVVEVLCSERFCDSAPAQVWATLLDEGTYLASISTMYRLLRERAMIRERRAQARRPPAHLKPELVATTPNQVWSWDIERHEALSNLAVVKGHRLPFVAADGLKLRAA